MIQENLNRETELRYEEALWACGDALFFHHKLKSFPFSCL